MPGHMTVTPETDGAVARILPHGLFNPVSLTYRVTNDGDAPINVTVALAEGFLAADVVGFTLAAGAHQEVVFTPDPDEIGGAAGSYADTITFTDTTNTATEERDVAIEQPLTITPTTASTFRRIAEGTGYAPESAVYRVTNGGLSSVDVTVSVANGYLEPDDAEFSLVGGAHQDVVFVPTNDSLDIREPGVHGETVTFSDATNDASADVEANLLLALGIPLAGSLEHAEMRPLGSYKVPGGWSGASVTITNHDEAAVDVEVSVAEGYLEADDVDFTIAGGDSHTVVFTPSAALQALTPTRVVEETITFSDVTDDPNVAEVDCVVSLCVNAAPTAGLMGTGN